MISIIIGYYRNKGMLEYQLASINKYAKHIRDQFEFIVIDDGSPDMPAVDVINNSDTEGMNLKLFRVDKDIPWNQVYARNLGATKAENELVFFLDIDHVIPEGMAEYLSTLKVNAGEYHTFGRRKVLRLDPYTYRNVNPSNCLFVISKSDFFRVGAYDVDFCGNYGYSDAWLKHRMTVGGIKKVLHDTVCLDCFMYTVIPQANDMSRERDKRKNRVLWEAKMRKKSPLNTSLLSGATYTQLL